MEVGEVKAYLNRQEERLKEFLAYEQSLRKQIEIEEEITSKIPDKDKEIIRLKETLSGLNYKINKLSQPKPQETKEEILNRISDIRAYKKRQEGEYEKTLSYREGIIRQMEEDEKRQKEFEKESQQKRDKVMAEIAQDIDRATNELIKIKNEKKDFVKSLSDKEKDLLNQSEEINQREKRADKELSESRFLNSQLDEKIKILAEERELLKKEGLLTIAKEREIADKIFSIKFQIDRISKEEEKIKIEKKALEANKEKIFIEKNKLYLREEAVDKSLDAISSIRKKLKEKEEYVEKKKKELSNKKQESYYLESKITELKNNVLKLDKEREIITNDLFLKKYNGELEYQQLVKRNLTIVSEINTNKDEVAKISEEKKAILLDISKEKIRLNNEAEILEKEKKIFQEKTDNNKKVIEEKEANLLETEKVLQNKLAEFEENKKEYGLLSEKIYLDREKLLEEKNFNENKNRELSEKINKLDKKIGEILILETLVKNEIANLDSKRKDLLQGTKEIAIKEEAISKTLNEFEKRELEISKKKEKFESQQVTLKLAFEELKKKEAKING